MEWGYWYPTFDGPCRELMQGKTVWALGSGVDRREYKLLRRLGAVCVMEVDKELREFPDGVGHRKVDDTHHIFGGTWTELMTADWSAMPVADVALVKWPANAHIWTKDKGVHDFLREVPSFVYVGRNTGITACAPKEFWEFCLGRELVEEVREARNDLLIYGKPCKKRKPAAREEISALRIRNEW